MKKLLGVSALAIALGVAGSAHAAGFQLQEYSVTNLGRAFAGQGVMGDDYSAIGYNPAGMAFNERSGMQIGATYIGIRSHVEGTDSGFTSPPSPSASRSGDASPYIARVLPSGFAQYKLNDKATVGLGIYSPFGLATDYANDWFGNSHALRSEIIGVNISPAISYKVLDQLTLGAALNVQYVEAKLTNKIEVNVGTGPIYTGGQANLQGDDTSLGYTLGAVFEPVKDRTRIGIAYRSKVDHKLHGTIEKNGSSIPTVNGTAFVNAKVTTPETVTISGMQKVTDDLTLSATARWTRWNQFNRLEIYQDTGVTPPSTNPISSTYEGWDNTWLFGLGGDYRINKQWTVRLGAAYDQSAVDSPAQRTARIPDAPRIWASLGLSYECNNWQVDAGYSHLFIKVVEAQHGADGSSNFDGKYSSNANIVGLNVQYKF